MYQNLVVWSLKHVGRSCRTRIQRQDFSLSIYKELANRMSSRKTNCEFAILTACFLWQKKSLFSPVFPKFPIAVLTFLGEHVSFYQTTFEHRLARKSAPENFAQACVHQFAGIPARRARFANETSGIFTTLHK